MPDPLVDVLATGAVCLGDTVICDGYANTKRVRVQTHIHDDHMDDFNKSKGLQDIFMSPETRELLIAEHNAELEYRDNLKPVRPDHPTQLDDGSKLTLLPSNHMLGACQVLLERPDGVRCGYSGDFSWPLADIIQADQLVVDATYGNPISVRNYTQTEAETSLLEVVATRLRQGPVHIKAHRGTIERVLGVLDGAIQAPIVASKRLLREVSVYQNNGFAVGVIHDLDSNDGQSAQQSGSYVRVYSKGDGFGNVPHAGTSITCSAYMVNRDDPLLKFSERSYQVALSNHADFKETLEFIVASGAKLVITDNTRTNGLTLANAINERLDGVTAMPSTNRIVYE
ncbi:MAG: hypothetical protein OXD33_10050 [Rhodobacteraceae bacterium]|nr:hypothetical protein [Paracoccaceae bacterium]